MKYIHFEHAHRRKHFEFFRRMDQPHFNVCAPIDITALRATLEAHQLAFTPAIVYLVAHTANTIPQFRHRIRGERVVEHEHVHPSITVATEAGVFGFCEITYRDDVRGFIAEAGTRMKEMAENPSMEDEPGRDDYLYLSSFPWVSFTSIGHAMHYSPTDSVPRITWGKFFADSGRIKLPLSVQAHHAVVDGRNMGQYFERIQELSDRLEEALRVS